MNSESRVISTSKVRPNEIQYISKLFFDRTGLSQHHMCNSLESLPTELINQLREFKQLI